MANISEINGYLINAESASYAANGGVTQLLAGPNVTLSPTNGKGQVTVSATLSGSTIFNTSTGSYGSFYDTTTQTNPVGNVPRSMSFNSTDITNGVLISGSTNPFNTYIKTTNAGVYNIQFSAQVDKTDAGNDEIVIWLRKNGIDLTDTATILTLSGNNDKKVAAWNWFVNSATNDYYQIIWISLDTDMRLLAEPISGTHPGIPSVILTVNRVDQFLSNTGSFSGSFTGAFTGSLFGTASWATNALSSSFANTASFVTTAQTASFVTGSIFTSVNRVLSASNALTASFALNGGVTSIVAGTNVTISPTNGLGAVTINSSGGGGAVFPFTGSAIISGSLTITGSLFAPTINFGSSSLTQSRLLLDNTFTNTNTELGTPNSVRDISPLLRIYGTYRTGSTGGGGLPQSILPVHIFPTWNPTNNNATNRFTVITLEPTFANPNVTASIARGLHLITGFTSLTYPNWRSIEWDNQIGYGWGLYGSGDAPNYLNGDLGIKTLTPSASLHVVGNAIITNGLTITGSLLITGSVISNTDGLNRLARYGTALSGSTIGTGVTAQTIVYSQLIPANTFVAGDIVRTYFRFRKLSTNANATYNILVNTSAAVAGATTLATLTANTVHNQMKRDFYIAQGNATTTVGSGINIATDDTNNTQLLSVINWTINQHIIYTVTLGTTDSGYGLGYTIEQVL